MKLYIKNMVCNRCKMFVQNELQQLGYTPIVVELGEVDIKEETLGYKSSELRQRLLLLGFDIIDDKKKKIIEKIKTTLIQNVRQEKGLHKVNLSTLLSSELHHDYNYLSNLFTEVEGVTIEKYFIAQKIERIKELLIYDEISISEIAYLMDYSSSAYLSRQFKNSIGLTPSHYKKLKLKDRKSLDQI